MLEGDRSLWKRWPCGYWIVQGGAIGLLWIMRWRWYLEGGVEGLEVSTTNGLRCSVEKAKQVIQALF